MYAVVGCSNCQALWIVADRPETTTCPRCGARHQFDRLKKFTTTEDREAAREVRSAMLASAQDRAEAYEKLDSVSEMAAAIESAGVDDREYLEGQGLDPDRVAAAATEDDTGSMSRRDRVLAALDALDEPTESAIVEYASEHGVPADAAREILAKLTRQGLVVRGPAGFRRL
ncbi:MAG: DUF5817 domain-containing protein [Halobacteriota archaeon]